jgi:hypothetical protein
MGYKRYRMGGFTVLKAKQIITTNKGVFEPLDERQLLAFKSFYQRFDQYKALIVCEDENGYLIVDGEKYFKSLKELGIKKIVCYNLGCLDEGEYEVFRLLLNQEQSRYGYLQVAQMVSKLVELKTKETTISNKTGISLKDVTKYSKLLSFDWDTFNKKKEDNQFNPFKNER